MRIVLCGLATFFVCSLTEPAVAEDLTSLSLEELMNIEVVSTPQFAGRIADLPASVTILTAGDFRAFGWRTLADALRSVRGFNITNDRIYSYAGVRGLSPPGDFKPRISVLIDGINITENIFNSALLGGEFPLDVDLIERIEIVRGPSASTFGGNALGGVLNIITRRGGALSGTEVTASAGSGKTAGARATLGGIAENGIEYLLSASGFDTQGEELKFPEMAPLGYGITTRNDDERRRQFFAKVDYQQWHATLIYGARDKTVATGAYGSIFNDASHHEEDIEALAEIGHQAWLSPTTSLTSRVYSGSYDFIGAYPYADPFYHLNRDTDHGKWWGAEARVQSSAWEGHQLLGGIEITRNYQQYQRNDDIGYGCIGYSTEPCLLDRRNSETLGIYGQDVIELGKQTLLTIGLRADHLADNDTHLSPRLGLVQHTANAGTFKLLYSTAFREPSVFEKNYVLPGIPSGNNQLQSEQMRSTEGNWEYALDTRTRISATLYEYQADHIVAPAADGLNTNLQTYTGRGAELELNRNWASGAELRASYTTQFPEMEDTRPANTPRHLLKLNLIMPIAESAWRSGVEVQAASTRRTEMDTTVSGFGITNINLIYAPAELPGELAFSIYNVFDHRYRDPIGADQYMDPSVVRDSMEQDGRVWRVKLTCHF